MAARLSRIDVAQAGGPGPAAAAARCLVPGAQDVAGAVAAIVEEIRTGGDEALMACVRRFDARGEEPAPLRVPEEELAGALAGLDPVLRAALERAAANISAVAGGWLGSVREVKLAEGHTVVLREDSVGRAGIYVPAGKAPLVSSLLMGVLTAQAAGVPDVAVCTPPGAGGDVDEAIKAAAALCGVGEVLRMGGAHAIAALAFGTETVARADVIAGPGSLYVQEAKRQLSGRVGIDSFAGPSDVLCICGPDAPVHEVALDLLAQGEHGAASIAAAAAWDAAWLAALEAELAALHAARPSAADGAYVLFAAASPREAAALADAFAPEHLQLVGAEAQPLAGEVRSAGCVFVGPWAGTAFGDYVAGSNHCLPTGGAARFESGLNPGHFRRRRAEVQMPPEAAALLAPAGAAIARAEGLPVHAESMEARIRENGAR